MNPLPDYYLALANAFNASEDVDMYDVRDHDPVSVNKLRELCHISDLYQFRLISYVIEHQGDLLDHFSETSA